jgi:hypothetical protein
MRRRIYVIDWDKQAISEPTNPSLLGVPSPRHDKLKTVRTGLREGDPTGLQGRAQIRKKRIPHTKEAYRTLQLLHLLISDGILLPDKQTKNPFELFATSNAALQKRVRRTTRPLRLHPPYLDQRQQPVKLDPNPIQGIRSVYLRAVTNIQEQITPRQARTTRPLGPPI